MKNQGNLISPTEHNNLLVTEFKDIDNPNIAVLGQFIELQENTDNSRKSEK